MEMVREGRAFMENGTSTALLTCTSDTKVDSKTKISTCLMTNLGCSPWLIQGLIQTVLSFLLLVQKRLIWTENMVGRKNIFARFVHRYCQLCLGK